MNSTSLLREAIGSEELAAKNAQRAANTIPAYQTFCREKQASVTAGFKTLPLTDKANYLRHYPFHELVGDDFTQTFTVFSSSGSSGRAFYWPQLKASHGASASRLRQFLEATFAIHERKTLAIIGLALGSWIGGDHFSWLLKNVAIETPYPFAVFSPGNKHDEIIAMLRESSHFTDQLLLVCCPSAIGHLILRAQEAGTPLPLEKMRYLVIGEPFPEMVRANLEDRSNLNPNETVMLSIYGSADTGVLGFESPASVLLRKLCHAEPEIAAELGYSGMVPHFFHQVDPEVYLETIHNELCVTRWQGIPLVRYNLHDSAKLYDWPSIVGRFSHWAQRYPAAGLLLKTLNGNSSYLLPEGLIAITGRADSCLILCGTNLTETMFDEAILASELTPFLTGAYQARLLLENGRQRLGLTLEYRPEAGNKEELVKKIYPLLIQSLGRVQPEFRDDWASIYKTWDDDPNERILALELVNWPELSRHLESKIKQRGIQK